MKFKTLFAVLICLFLLTPTKATAAPSINNVRNNLNDYSNQTVPKYKKFEASFTVQNTVAKNFFFPYDSNPPAGVNSNLDKFKGISVDAQFLPPGQTNWEDAYQTPAFYYQYFEESQHNNREWYLPTNNFDWKVRFSPNVAGTWKYRLKATDASGSATSSEQSFNVSENNNKGFLKVSNNDTRYFQFDNGEFFVGNGYHGYDPNNSADQTGIDFTRTWYSSMYGTAWTPYQGVRNQYNGYLPRPGLYPLQNPSNPNDYVLTRRLDVEQEGNTGWFDNCIFYKWPDTPAIKPNTKYKIQVTYLGKNINAPSNSSKDYGLALSFNGCNNDNPVTNFGKNTNNNWGTIEGTWTSGSNTYFLPSFSLYLNNVSVDSNTNNPQAYFYKISIKEDLGGGNLGVEITDFPSNEVYTYVSSVKAHNLDKEVELHEEKGLYNKWVLMDKEDTMYIKMDDDGTFVMGGESDNMDGFYGLGRGVNKTRWLQQAWWRYIQARWGYSTSIHSFEVTNEGDPAKTTHYELTDEMGKFFKCRVFGISVGTGNGQKCNYNHPNSHMVTTSFWHSFPGSNFWGNNNYPNVDYADVHAYLSTSNVTNCNKEQMEKDAVLFYSCHSDQLFGWKINKPIVRGEFGFDTADSQNPYALKQKYGVGLQDDTQGIWFHNLNWAKLGSGALYDIYWYHENLYDSNFDLRPIYKRTYNFLKDIPLNNGNYKSINAIVTNTNLRVLGQKDTVNNNAHLWVQNKNHTWYNITKNNNISPVSDTVTISGFSPNTSLTLQKWDTYSQNGNYTTSQITSNNNGEVQIAVNNLTTDTAYKIIGSGATNPTPTATPTNNPTPTNKPYNAKIDLNEDGINNLQDVIELIKALFT